MCSVTPVRRLPRGTRVDPIQTPWVIERSAKERFDAMARNAGMSSAAFLEAVIDHLASDLTNRGVPAWLPQPEPDEEELPLDDK